MADNPSVVSSITPSESASYGGTPKRNRPGKNARNAARTSALTPPASAVTGAASFANAAQFASAAVSAPVPQPGKFPVVFATGAGEPTQDEAFSYDHRVLKQLIAPIANRYIYSARYAEFSANSGYSDTLFRTDIIKFLILGIAQQTVYSHVNMGLPLGDFSSVASTDVFHFNSLRSVVSQFGELSVPSIGTRFLLSDYASTVSSLTWVASQFDGSDTDLHVVDRAWLPMHKLDKRTKHVVAVSLARYVSTLGLDLKIENLVEDLFELGTVPNYFVAAKGIIPEPDRDRFDFLFNEYDTTADWVAAFTGASPQRALSLIDLIWRKPNTAHLNFAFVTKVEFPRMVDEWARKRATILKFFSCGSSIQSRSTAIGSTAQLSSISEVPGVTVLRTLLALSAQEFSLLACFPASGYSRSVSEYKVVVSTSIPVSVRATEFAQGDWL